MVKILVTGGAGYIGSHTCESLIHAGYDPIIYDNFSNSHPAVISRLETLTRRKIDIISGDVRDTAKVTEALQSNNCRAVVHFAGLKSVNQSMENPLHYYSNNVVGTYSVLAAMAQSNVNAIIFSSSATVYGAPTKLPIKEEHSTQPVNPYGQTKLIAEQILRDVGRADRNFKSAILRYFNPAGAHESGLIGEAPSGKPNNLMPYIAQVAIKRQKILNIYGNDYETPDKTCIRDYVHVMDLAEAHTLSTIKLLSGGESFTVNLGTGQGHSIIEVINEFEKACGFNIPYRFLSRRSGDVPMTYADIEKADKVLGWKTTRTLYDMCHDLWHWQSSNPAGYERNYTRSAFS